MKPGDGSSDLETLLRRAERLLAEMDRFPDGEPLYAEACDTIVTVVRDLGAEVSRLRDALRPLGLNTEDAIDESAERGRLMREAPVLQDPKKPLAGYRIGVVDDEPDTLDAIALVLQQAGALVRSYPSAIAALAGIRMAPPHLLVSDLAMPGYDGLWLVSQVRATRRLELLPALALSAHTLAQDVEAARRAGFDAHLAKPTQPDRLIAEVCRLLERRAHPTGA
jgi:CheY-like chemotaxis protein